MTGRLTNFDRPHDGWHDRARRRLDLLLDQADGPPACPHRPAFRCDNWRRRSIMLRTATAPLDSEDPLREILEHVRALGEKDLSLALAEILPLATEGVLMRYGVVLFTSDRGITPGRAAQAAEAAGFDCFYVPEHTHIPVRRDALHPRTGTQDLPDDRYLRTLDPWVSLSMAAADTVTIRLGTAVALPAEHDPIALAKTIATLDHLSGGRVELGVGFGWNTDELSDHGVPAGRRRSVLREYLEAMQELWSEAEASYDGEFISFGASWAWPKPVQQPRIPIIIGAGGTERTFAWIARSGDGWLTTPGEAELDAKVALLQQTWHEAGRDGKPRITVLAGKPDPAVLAHWDEIGVTQVAFGMPDRAEDEVVGYLGRLAGKLGLAPVQAP